MTAARRNAGVRAGAARAAALALVALGSLSSAALADPPLAPREVRAERLIHEERPLWREALALPDDVLLLLFWPVKHALFWAERTHLDDRIGNLFTNPFHRRSEDEP